MEKMMVIVFDNEKRAYEGARALLELDQEGGISLHAQSIIKKEMGGAVKVKQEADDLPARTIGGSAIGSLIGLIGGPVGVGIGFATGMAAGFLSDVYVSGVGEEFFAEVASSLTPGKSAVVADLEEEWITPVDLRMESLGGVVIRQVKQDFEDELRARDITALREEISELQAEHKSATTERKAKLQAKIAKLEAKLQTKINDAKLRSEQLKNEAYAKVTALKKNAEALPRETREVVNARITTIKQHYDEAEAKLRHATAEQLKRTAAKLEQAE